MDTEVRRDTFIIGPACPGENLDAYIERIAQHDPTPTPELCAHLARLLPMPPDGGEADA